LTGNGKFLLFRIDSFYADFTAKDLTMVTPGKKVPKRPLLPAGILFVRLLPYMRNTGKRILIADGNDTFRESLGAFIKGLGHEVFEVATGRAVIDTASSIHPDLIMMDLCLPGMNGDVATARLKANMSTRNIPVVINTGWTTACNVEERANRALIAGAAEILYKPFHFPTLRNVLRSHLSA
jgi:two-component system cell cycle response regulator DivK